VPHANLQKRFGARVRKLRLGRGWTQVDFAERLGLDRSYLAQIEGGQRNVSLAIIETIATGFGVSISQLFRQL
jgi:transcriptional regulator with XRE-family HTH domain